MSDKIINSLKSQLKLYKTLIVNFSSLTVLQFFNYLFPLVTFPYLVRVLGPENYGLYSIILAVTYYFVIIFDWGLNIYGVQQIAVSKNEGDKINFLISNFYGVKTFLFFLLVPLSFSAGLVFDLYQHYLNIFILAWGIVLGRAMLPDWFFIGVEKIQVLTVVTVIVKTLMVAAIFIFIQSSEDLDLLLGIQASASIIISVMLIIILKIGYSISFNLSAFISFRHGLKNSFEYFISGISRTLYTQTAVIMLGIFESKETAGYFSVADNIRFAVQSIFSNLSTALYPKTSVAFKNNISAGLIRVKKLLKITPVVFIVLVIFAELLAPQIIDAVAGDKYLPSIFALRVLLPSIVFISISSILGMHLLTNIGYQKTYMKILLANSLLHIPVIVFLVNSFSLIGAAASILFTETLIALSFYLKSRNAFKKNFAGGIESE